MSTLGEFKKGAQVFILGSEWMGVEVIKVNDETGAVKARVVWTNSIPGFSIGEVIQVSTGEEAYESLTVEIAAKG